jgi:hypothetical protein
VYTSTTNKNPSSYSPKTISTRAATGKGKTYTTYVPANAKDFYFSVKGMTADVNKFNFIVRVRPLDF